ncbi:hypothetical protein HO173_004839 [Letharia columbiana]|uniref:Zn(2)-C6 fungal-type domain-containing protein n=1 Tax=Letharia columbiana TaxID=112416 RepID=A0A8H6FY22_9LECA|nr:uncharacterized protein HO173_004839 [Letharia columbiana]KAF6236960.1 hypothetical protein HO173_004839 [Letharia columbiana]
METGLSPVCDSRQCPVPLYLGARSQSFPRREPCVLVTDQGNDLIERRTCYSEHVPRAPPPSPTKLTPLTCAELNEACPSASCALLLVDRKIEAHRARLSPTEHRKPPGWYSHALMSDSVSRMKLETSDEQMHRMTPLQQISSASDDDDTTVTNSSCPSSRSSGTNTLVNDLPGDREVAPHSTAIGVHYQRKIATCPQLATQPPSPKSPTFSLFNLRSSRTAMADAPSRLRSPSQSSDSLGPRPTVTGSQISSLTPIGSSAIPDIAGLPLVYEQSKTKSWPGSCSSLPGPDIVSMPKFTTRPKSRDCDFAYAYCRERKAERDGVIPSCRKCLSRSETCSFNKYCTSLQPLEEHARGKETMDEQEAATMEEEHSHFSDYSTDEDDDGEKIPSNARLFNSLGRLHSRSKPRLSWGNLFSRS